MDIYGWGRGVALRILERVHTFAGCKMHVRGLMGFSPFSLLHIPSVKLLSGVYCTLMKSIGVGPRLGKE